VPRRGGEKGGCDRTVLQRCRDCRRQPSRGSPAIDSGGRVEKTKGGDVVGVVGMGRSVPALGLL
jgi:hypothetical protein